MGSASGHLAAARRVQSAPPPSHLTVAALGPCVSLGQQLGRPFRCLTAAASTRRVVSPPTSATFQSAAHDSLTFSDIDIHHQCVVVFVPFVSISDYPLWVGRHRTQKERQPERKKESQKKKSHQICHVVAENTPMSHQRQPRV